MLSYVTDDIFCILPGEERKKGKHRYQNKRQITANRKGAKSRKYTLLRQQKSDRIFSNNC